MWPVYLLIAWFVLALVVPPAWSSAVVYSRAKKLRGVSCPVGLQPAVIQADALYAIRTNFSGDARLRVQECSLWPEREGCGQDCLAHAGQVTGRAAARARLALS